jgi:hypothetical protein
MIKLIFKEDKLLKTCMTYRILKKCLTNTFPTFIYQHDDKLKEH